MVYVLLLKGYDSERSEARSAFCARSNYAEEVAPICGVRSSACDPELESSTFKTLTLGDEDDLDSVLTKAYAAWHRCETWESDFTQTHVQGEEKTIKKGHVVFSNSGKFCLHYSEPEEIVASFGGNHIVAYNPGKKVADQITIPFIDSLVKVMGIAQTPTVVKLLYSVEWTQPRRSDAYSLQFSPRIPFVFEPNLAKCRVAYNKTTYLADEFELDNKQGGWVVHHFNWKPAGAENASAFEVHFAPGTQVNEKFDIHQVLARLFLPWE